MKFKDDGTFKIIQFNDTQDDHLTDARTLDFMAKVLDTQRPDFVVINGDVIAGAMTTTQVYQAFNNVVMPMESRGIPWAITLGNHDIEASALSGARVNGASLVDFAMRYKHNKNTVSPVSVGASNAHIVIEKSDGTPGFSLWLLDSLRYHHTERAGQSTEYLPAYDYLRPEQVQWYFDTSLELEHRWGRKVPGLMWFHIPTFEHRDMWFGGPFHSSQEAHEQAKIRHQIVGEKNEDVCMGALNSGIYAAVQQRGDVLGMYCGHDHVNTFMGNYFGVELGYGPGTGFGSYGLGEGEEKHSLRGCRVFELNENTPQVYTSTHTLFAHEYGISMDPQPQKLEEPLPFPSYIQPVN